MRTCKGKLQKWQIYKSVCLSLYRQGFMSFEKTVWKPRKGWLQSLPLFPWRSAKINKFEPFIDLAYLAFIDYYHPETF